MPLAIAVLFPMLYGAVWWTTARAQYPGSAWFAPAFLALLQAGSLGLAYFSGVRARFFSAANGDLMAIHVVSAERFIWEWGLVAFVVIIAVALRNRRFAVYLHFLVMVLLAVQLYEAIRLGHAGGQLLH